MGKLSSVGVRKVTLESNSRTEQELAGHVVGVTGLDLWSTSLPNPHGEARRREGAASVKPQGARQTRRDIRKGQPGWMADGVAATERRTCEPRERFEDTRAKVNNKRASFND